jgi:hypothetical protein
VGLDNQTEEEIVVYQLTITECSWDKETNNNIERGWSADNMTEINGNDV